MKKINTLLVSLLLLTITTSAQKVNPKHTNYYKNITDVATTEYVLNFSDVVSRTVFCKLALKITNKTNDFLLFERGDSKFEFDFGSFSDQPKEFFIKPNSSKSKVLEANGGEQFHVDKFNLKVDGISIVPLTGDVSKMEDFPIPASKNAVNTDLFKVNLTKSSLKTQEAVLQFECTYLGNKIGLINPSKLVIKVDDSGREYANDNKDDQIEMVRKGEEVKFKAVFHIPGKVADMQFANMTIIWKDTFVETETKKLEGQQVSFELDSGMTNGKN